MRAEELHRFYERFKFGEETFHQLMKRRVKHVLLVSSVYDAYVLEQDGRLSEQIIGEYRQLNLSQAPRVTTVSTPRDALLLLHDDEIDMVIVMARQGEACIPLGEKIREQRPDIPLLLLLNPAVTPHHRAGELFDDIFVWSGEATLFLAMIKSVEDRWNADNDTVKGLVQVILLAVHDPHDFSQVLPLLYTEIMRQTQKLIRLELNEMNKRLRMRARPKVLLTHDDDEAHELFDRYSDSIIGVIADTRQHEDEGGLALVRQIRERREDVPILLLSDEQTHQRKADDLDAAFMLLNSAKLKETIRGFLHGGLGFGDFVFRTPQGEEISRASKLVDFERELTVLPVESILYHGARNDFSTWLLARGETIIARELRKKRNSDFASADDQRRYLIRTFNETRQRQNRGKIINFDIISLFDDDKIIRLGEGSLGGKGRGLAFLNALLVTMDFDKIFPDIHVRLPRTVIIGTAEFDWFIEHNNIRERALDLSDAELKELFLSGELSPQLHERLGQYVGCVDWPLAVRSSGLLEDSQSQPFAGVYATYMTPNNHYDFMVKLDQLEQAVKLVFASPFLSDARSYIEGVNYDLDDEKMAVIIQEIAGRKRDDGLYYPLFSGVAQSYNYYPLYTKHEEGVASLAAGLGKAVVDGERAFRFCPAHPRVDFVKPEELVKNAQTEFYGLDMTSEQLDFTTGEDATLERVSIGQKEKQGVLRPLTSQWDWEYLRFNDSEYAQGARALTFRNVTRYNRFPLPEALTAILDFGQLAHGAPVEIEFAVTLGGDDGKQGVFHLLQIRPLTVRAEDTELDLEEADNDSALLLSSQALGNGVIDDIRDVVWVDPERFDNTRTPEIAMETEQVNRALKDEQRQYVLLGPGRWGSSDRFLGAPVKWAQIDHARVIVETGLPDFPVDASQGSHFFHNLVAMNIGYFTVAWGAPPNRIDWDWLRAQPREFEGEWITHTRLSKPLNIRMDGRRGAAVIAKPADD